MKDQETTTREPLAVMLGRTRTQALPFFRTAPAEIEADGRVTWHDRSDNLEQAEAAWREQFQARSFDMHHPALLWEKDRHGTRRTASYLPKMVKFGKHCYPTQDSEWMAE